MAIGLGIVNKQLKANDKQTKKANGKVKTTAIALAKAIYEAMKERQSETLTLNEENSCLNRCWCNGELLDEVPSAETVVKEFQNTFEEVNKYRKEHGKRARQARSSYGATGIIYPNVKDFEKLAPEQKEQFRIDVIKGLKIWLGHTPDYVVEHNDEYGTHWHWFDRCLDETGHDYQDFQILMSPHGLSNQHNTILGYMNQYETVRMWQPAEDKKTQKGNQKWEVKETSINGLKASRNWNIKPHELKDAGGMSANEYAAKKEAEKQLKKREKELQKKDRAIRKQTKKVNRYWKSFTDLFTKATNIAGMSFEEVKKCGSYEAGLDEVEKRLNEKNDTLNRKWNIIKKATEPLAEFLQIKEIDDLDFTPKLKKAVTEKIKTVQATEDNQKRYEKELQRRWDDVVMWNDVLARQTLENSSYYKDKRKRFDEKVQRTFSSIATSENARYLTEIADGLPFEDINIKDVLDAVVSLIESYQNDVSDVIDEKDKYSSSFFDNIDIPEEPDGGTLSL